MLTPQSNPTAAVAAAAAAILPLTKPFCLHVGHAAGEQGRVLDAEREPPLPGPGAPLWPRGCVGAGGCACGGMAVPCARAAPRRCLQVRVMQPVPRALLSAGQVRALGGAVHAPHLCHRVLTPPIATAALASQQAGAPGQGKRAQPLAAAPVVAAIAVPLCGTRACALARTWPRSCSCYRVVVASQTRTQRPSYASGSGPQVGGYSGRSICAHARQGSRGVCGRASPCLTWCLTASQPPQLVALQELQCVWSCSAPSPGYVLWAAHFPSPSVWLSALPDQSVWPGRTVLPR